MASSKAIEHFKFGLAENLCDSLLDALRPGVPGLAREEGAHGCSFSSPRAGGTGRSSVFAYINHQKKKGLKIYPVASVANEPQWRTLAVTHQMAIEKRKTIRLGWQSRTPFFFFVDSSTILTGAAGFLNAIGNREEPALPREILELDAQPVETPPDGFQFVLTDIEVPPPRPAESQRKRHVNAFNTDWDAVTAYSRKLGEQGERFVFNLERRRLRDAGRLDLERRIEWVSQLHGDGAGYDIRSFDGAGEEIFIEVKTTKGPEITAFYVTANELRCSEERGSAYMLYRVFQFGTAPKFYRLPGPLASVLNLEPRVYSAQCKGTTAR